MLYQVVHTGVYVQGTSYIVQVHRVRYMYIELLLICTRTGMYGVYVYTVQYIVHRAVGGIAPALLCTRTTEFLHSSRTTCMYVRAFLRVRDVHMYIVQWEEFISPYRTRYHVLVRCMYSVALLSLEI